MSAYAARYVNWPVLRLPGRLPLGPTFTYLEPQGMINFNGSA